MTVERPASILDVLAGKISAPVDLPALADRYRTADPFPHIVIDNLFPPDLLKRVVAEIPSTGEGDWLQHDEDKLIQYTMRSALELKSAGSELVSTLHSAPFLYFLSELSGVWQLLPDPYLQGAAVHMIPPGGFFAVHADRNTAYETGLFRRLSLIIYLNEGWRPEYGGQLELWNADGTNCEKKIDPVFNRTVIFEIADANFHGVPAAISHPRGESRKSFMAYYHTSRPTAEHRNVHTSVYAPSFYRQESALNRILKDLTPPLLRKAATRLIRK